jgi:hypothetical protein
MRRANFLITTITGTRRLMAMDKTTAPAMATIATWRVVGSVSIYVVFLSTGADSQAAPTYYSAPGAPLVPGKSCAGKGAASMLTRQLCEGSPKPMQKSQ